MFQEQVLKHVTNSEFLKTRRFIHVFEKIDFRFKLRPKKKH